MYRKSINPKARNMVATVLVSRFESQCNERQIESINQHAEMIEEARRLLESKRADLFQAVQSIVSENS